MLSRKLTQEDCDKWNKNKLKNPITNYRISNKSKVFNLIKNQCETYQSDNESRPKHNEYTLEECLEWEKNKSRNPKTRYTLSEKSKIRKHIQETCEPLLKQYYKNNNNNNNTSNTKNSSQLDTQSFNKSSSLQMSSNTAESIKTPPSIKLSDVNDVSNTSGNFDLYYPDLNDEYFQNKIAELYKLYKVSQYKQVKSKEDFVNQSNKLCGEFEKTLYQYFISNYISSRTPYNGILLYHGVGVGKTCSSITLAEGFLTTHAMHEEPKIWVVMPSALRTSFNEQIFSIDNINNYDFLANQCTGDSYIKLAQILRNSTRDKVESSIKKLIKTRYRLFTYDKFASFIEDNYIKQNIPVTDKVIIVDEAHNIRSKSSLSDDDEKRVYSSLLNIASIGKRNRMVLLSATPMYDQPDDILDLLYLLDLNDNRNILKQPFPKIFNNDNSINPDVYNMIQKLSSNYISYLKGKNPFTFAVKLSPKDFLPKLRFLKTDPPSDVNGKQIDDVYKNWISEIDESIVLSDIGEKQRKYLATLQFSDDNHVFKHRQPMNIVFENNVGEKGFSEFFMTNDEANSISVTYKSKYKNALLPDKNHLGKYSGKFLNLMNILKNSKGIVVIYSGYIWSGIVPIATCLEHMGFNREGSNNILKKPDIIDDAPLYGQKTSPKYCIFTSDQKEVMGTSTIDKLLKIVNSPENIDGSLIKVILMTPVASEGLSFFNVREMHIIDPWFHMNKIEQIVGRGIRNCRHQMLPIEERNVSVFLHATYDNDDKETSDIAAYRISSKKYIQTKKMNNIIKDNAVDCHLMKNINYFPKSLFELGKISITTSQNTKFKYEYGDDDSEEPQCKYRKMSSNNQKYRKDMNHHFVTSLKNKIKTIVLKSIEEQTLFIPIDNILNYLEFDDELSYQAINESLYPNTLINEYMLISYKNGIQILKIHPETVRKIKIVDNSKQEVSQIKKQFKPSKLEIISKKEIHEATLELYNTMTPFTFEGIVGNICRSETLNEVNTIIAKYLYKQGALIKKSEIPDVRYISGNEYIGYVDIFNIKFKPLLLSDKDTYRELTSNELNLLMRNRKVYSKPDDMSKETNTWGTIVPIFDKKKKIYKNMFKIFMTGPSRGVKTGIDCSSLLKKYQEQILQEYGITDEFQTKQKNCLQIAIALMKNKRMIMYPEYKPK